MGQTGETYWGAVLVSVTAAAGFVASGVSAGIRPSGLPDVAVVRSLPRAVGAALWTTNRVQAAPVTVSKRHLELAQPQAVLINAGVANAATGVCSDVQMASASWPTMYLDSDGSVMLHSWCRTSAVTRHTMLSRCGSVMGTRPFVVAAIP